MERYPVFMGQKYCCCSVAQSCLILCDPMDCSTPGFPVLHHLLELAQIHIHWVGDASQPSHPLLSPSPLTSIFPSIRVFYKESVLRMRWPKYWSFSFSICPSNEYSGLISFTTDWLDMTERLNWTNFLLNLLDLSLSSNLCAGRKLSSGLYSAVLTEHSGYISR